MYPPVVIHRAETDDPRRPGGIERAASMAAIAGFAAVAVLLAASAWHDRALVVDDAWITARYARNFADGLGFRWNAASAPWEGFTSPLAVVMLGAAMRMGADPIVASLVINVVAVAGILIVLVAAARPSAWYFPIAALPVLRVILGPDLLTHASRGLETLQFSFFAVVCATLTGSATRAAHRRGPFVWLGVASFVVLLSRPEGLLVAAACWFAAALIVNRRRESWRELAPGFAIWIGSTLVYLIWKWSYFGDIFPSGYYFKASVPAWSGFGETRDFLRAHLIVLAAAAGTGVCGVMALVGRRRPASVPAEALVALVAGIGWCVYSARILHEMGFAHRFAYPLVPLAALGATKGIAFLVDRPEVLQLASGRVLRSVAWATLAAAVALAWPRTSALAGSLRVPEPEDRFAAYVRLGKALGELGLGDAIFLVTAQAGALPYYSRARHLDMAGLASGEMSRRVPEDERLRLTETIEGDVEVSTFPPASAGATSFDGDPEGRSAFMTTWLLPAEVSVARFGSFTPSKQSWRSIVFREMCRLRDVATLVGELDVPQPGWRAFVYVGNHSRYRDLLIRHLSTRVDMPVARIR